MAPEIRLALGGDIMLGEHPAMVGRGTATRLRRRPDFDPFVAVRGVFREADLALANLECALSDWPRFCSPSRRECRGPAAAIGRLSESGLTAVTIANNHIQQHGPAAVRETVAALERAGLAVVGLAGEQPGRCRPVDLEPGGRPVRLLGYSLRPRQGFSETPLYAEGTREGILEDVAAGKAAGRSVIVTIHWGDEFVHAPSRDQVELGHAMVDAGCDLVVGHHPHVLQGWERRGRGAILYSLGNLVFDMPWQANVRRTAVCTCALGPEGLGRVDWHPFMLDEDHRPRPAEGEDARWIAAFLGDSRRHLEAGSGPWAAPDAEAYREQLAHADSSERWTRNRYFLMNLHRYRPDVAGQLIGKFVLRRLRLLDD